MNVTSLPLDLIDTGARLRALDPAWVTLLAEQIAEDGQNEPIRVVRRGERFALIAGAHRVAAHMELGRTSIDASIETEEAFKTDAALRLAEIKSDMMRGELTVLARAIYVTAWRDIYVSALGRSTRGRKPKDAKSENRVTSDPNSLIPANQNDEDPFVLNQTDAAKRALGLSQMALKRALKIGTIDRRQAHRLTGHPSANSQAELLLLAEQSVARQKAIVDLLITGDPTEAATVADAIVRIDCVAAPPKPWPYERVHQTFSRLNEVQQNAFFDLNTEAIERWQAARAVAVAARKPRKVA